MLEKPTIKMNYGRSQWGGVTIVLFDGTNVQFIVNQSSFMCVPFFVIFCSVRVKRRRRIMIMAIGSNSNAVK